MAQAPALYAGISGHGLGHLSQVAPILNAWRRRHPESRLVVQTALPEAVVRSRVPGELRIIPAELDFGLRMVDALTVELEESWEAYRTLGASWEQHLEQQVQHLREASVDVVLADIPFFLLAGAAELQIPSVALCSLNWAEVLRAYFGERPGVEDLLRPLETAYNSAEVFLCPEPSMPMPSLHNARSIGPIGVLGTSRRVEVEQRLGGQGQEMLGLIALGGLPMDLSLNRWPQRPGVCWLVPPGTRVAREDFVEWSLLQDLAFVDLVASVDILVTKPGYGAYVEAASHGTPVLYVERSDWPEEPGLSTWLKAHGRARSISRENFFQGRIEPVLSELRALPPVPQVDPTGAQEALEWLEQVGG